MTYKKDQRDFTQFLQDILDAIDDIEGFTGEWNSMSFPAIRKPYMP